MKNQRTRRSDFDVADTIKVTEPCLVRDYVSDLYAELYGSTTQGIGKLRKAFTDFALLFDGHFEDYRACDTLYHDTQHTLDMTLTMARLLHSYEHQHPRAQLGSDRFLLGIIIALFHDSGYIRRQNDQYANNGAVYTLTHVSRSGEFLRNYLPKLDMTNQSELASILVHFTGYEIEPHELPINNYHDAIVGHLLGTADLISQMSDRCYLEKCRDRLYPEFVLCGMAGEQENAPEALFKSPEDLLLKTPAFFRNSVMVRLERSFNSVFNYVELFFNGVNLYMESIDKNIRYLEVLCDKGDFSALRRNPPDTDATQEFPFHLLDIKQLQANG